MSYDKFMDNYRKIIHKCYSKLKDNRFAGFVITELRDPKTGGYKNFLLDTITAFEDAGFVFYNDIIFEENITWSPSLISTFGKPRSAILIIAPLRSP